MTDSQGGFFYQDGEDVTFYIGSVVLGQSSAKGIVTPVDLGGGTQTNFNTNVINISRFLISLDEDGNPNNGITIPQSVRDALVGIKVDFSDPTLDNDAGVKKMFEKLNGLGIFPEEQGRGLVSSQDAQVHLSNTLNQITAEDEIAAEELKNLTVHASIDLPLFSNVIMVQNQSLNLQGSAFGGKPPYSFSWHMDSEKPFSAKQSPGKFTFKAQGSYNLFLTVKDSTGDTSTIIRHITVFSPDTQTGPFAPDSIPTATLLSPAPGSVFKIGDTVDFQAMIFNGNVPLYYDWGIGYDPQNQDVIFVSPRTYIISQSVTLAVPGSYLVNIFVRDTAVDGNRYDEHAASVPIVVK
ncbi:MAG TPA: PKD domain-containing protein [Desulfomonilia bacterium]|nr:PKD domain-containing protein [Desulfomonilia bacterium]